VKDFLEHIYIEHARFDCYDPGDAEQQLGFYVEIHNTLNGPAKESDLGVLRQLLPANSEELVDLYRLHDGLTLYRHCEAEHYPNGDMSGVIFYPIEHLRAHNAEWKAFLLEQYGSAENFDCEFQRYGTAFGENSYSLKSFVWFDGKVFYDNHDNLTETPIAASFSAFLSLIARDPAAFLDQCGLTTRYSDSKTDVEWIPKVFTVRRSQIF
jgi:hypothetical protein